LEAFDSSDFLNKNHNGMVPVLEDGQFTLWESNAIIQDFSEGQVG
jgi:glutathione S-transferase